jgi:adenylate cyclase
VRRRGVLLAATAAIAALAGGVVDWTGVLQRAEGASLDSRFAVRGTQHPDSVVVVGIDSRTLSSKGIPSWPWPRSLQGRLIRDVHALHPRLIVYDVQITEPTTQAQDLALYNAVSAARPVVMVTTEVGAGGATRILGGNQNLRAIGALPAWAQFPSVTQGEVRRLATGFRGLDSVALVAARAIDHPVRVKAGATPLVDFPGGSGTVREVPAIDVLRGSAPAGALQGRIAVVGLVAQALGDVHATGADGGSQLSGPELESDAITTALAGFPLHGAPGWLDAVLVAFSALLAPALAARRSAALGTVAAVAWLVAGAVLAQLAFNRGTVLELMPPLTATLLSGIGVNLVDLTTVRRERTQLIATFERYVPRDHVGRVVARAQSKAGAGLAGEELEATVMFCDLKGYTGYAEHRPPDELLQTLNQYLGQVSDAVMDHGGSVVSFLGDGVMAVFGAPLASDDHAGQALAAARAVVAGVGAARVGVGLASGPVISGTVGSGRRMEYAAIGDTTNVAARVQAMTRELHRPILLTARTHELLGAAAEKELECLGEFKLRGREQPLALWATPETEPAPDPPAEPVSPT